MIVRRADNSTATRVYAAENNIGRDRYGEAVEAAVHSTDGMMYGSQDGALGHWVMGCRVRPR